MFYLRKSKLCSKGIGRKQTRVSKLYNKREIVTKWDLNNENGINTRFKIIKLKCWLIWLSTQSNKRWHAL